MDLSREMRASLFPLALAWIAVFVPSTGSAQTAGATSPHVNMKVDGKEISLSRQKTINLSHSANEVIFELGPPFSKTVSAKRIRYQLEGYDSNWMETPGEMRLGLRFYDENDAFVSQESFPARGVSSGWKGSANNSTFTHRRQLITVPPRGTAMQVFISSAGPPSSVGIYVVSDIIVARVQKDGSTGPTILDSNAFLSMDRSTKPEKPAEWIRDGDQPAMAQLIQVGGTGFKDRAFCLLDDNSLSHTEWHQTSKLSEQVKPGDQFIIQWNEMFNTGDANFFYVVYQHLKPGRYRFLAHELDSTGLPTARESVVDFVIPQPYWKNPWLWAGGLLAASALMFYLVRYLIQVKIRRRLEHLQQQHLLQQERLRIARDIHDDLGARLTQISLVSGMAENEAETQGDRKRFTEISAMSRELVFAMYETVWTVNPQNDHLESLVSFLCQSTENLCKPAGIRCRIKASPVLDNREVRSEIRHNVILAIKETVHNAIKHSQATEIELQITFDQPRLKITLSDNGHGFDTAAHKSGHGLKNLERRMDTVGGSVTVESSKQSGTKIYFSIPIP